MSTTTVTVADLLGHQPGPSAHRHRLTPPSEARTPRPRTPRGAGQRRRRILVGGLLAITVCGLSLSGAVVQQAESQDVTGDAAGAAAQAREWLDSYAPGPVLTDSGFRAQLLDAGWDPNMVATTTSCDPACGSDWLVSTPALRSGLASEETLDSAVRNSTPVAVFGSGVDRVEIRHPGVSTADQTAAELRARTTAGRDLTRSPRVAADPGVQALLDTGRVDPRVLAMVARLTQRGTVRILDLPAVPGEDAAGQSRRQILLATSPDQADALSQFFSTQSGPYRPVAITRTPAGLLVRYPPTPPPHLLDTP